MNTKFKKNNKWQTVIIWSIVITMCFLSGCQQEKSEDINMDLTSSLEASSPLSSTSSESSINMNEEPPLLQEDGWQQIPDLTNGEAGTLCMKYQPKYATGFSIEYYYGGAKIIDTHIQATANTAASTQRILILPEGSIEPKDAVYDYKIEGKLERAITLASSHAGHFANLNAIPIVKGTSIKEDSCYISDLKDALATGQTQYVGSGTNADKERIASLNPQIVFIGGMQTDVELAKKLEESGIFCFYFGDFAEEHYMGRAQWIELIGALIGKEQEAQDFMKENEKQVNDVISKVWNQPEKPKVLWFTHSSEAPHWNVRTDTDYVNSMVTAAGGIIYFPQGSEKNSVRLSNEDFLPLMLQADKIVFGVSLNSYKDAKDITFFNKEGQIDFSQSKAYTTGDCYVVGYDWAQDTASAGQIIRSIATAFYPELFVDKEDTNKLIKFKVE